MFKSKEAKLNRRMKRNLWVFHCSGSGIRWNVVNCSSFVRRKVSSFPWNLFRVFKPKIAAYPILEFSFSCLGMSSLQPSSIVRSSRESWKRGEIRREIFIFSRKLIRYCTINAIYRCHNSPASENVKTSTSGGESCFQIIDWLMSLWNLVMRLKGYRFKVGVDYFRSDH